MCGIVGYIGKQQAAPILMDGLERLSYRGYDSAGIAVLHDGVQVRKAKGRLQNLAALLEGSPLLGNVGIGHTRWATHGEPSDLNAHPHTDVQGGIAVVHNGIIENHESLRRYLQNEGAVFVSQTDTEVIAHLLHHLDSGDLRAAMLRAMGMLEGSYAIAVVSDREPGRLYCARNDSPLVIGVKDGEGFLASDIPALLSHTRDVIFLGDRELAVLDAQGVHVYDAYGGAVQHTPFHVDWELCDAQKGGYAHYMLKEIHEQPTALQNTFAPRYAKGGFDWLPLCETEVRRLRKITIAACGTAYHAGVLGKYAIERLARIPVEIAIASEYRYRDPIVAKDELFIAVSQSGETADTLAALREAKRRGARVMAVCNVVGSSITREAGEENTLYTYAGPEIAVASTKAYLTQAELLVMLAAALGAVRGVLEPPRMKALLDELAALPQKAEEALECEQDMQRLCSLLSRKKHAFFVGRGADFALSMEAALKLKEVSYVFSEAYAAGELKHGPIALLEQGRLVVATLTQPQLLQKTLGNLQEIAARGAWVAAVCTRSLARHVAPHVAQLIVIPDADEVVAPILAAIPLQLFAYCMAVERGCDVDKPRNLAKSVTVE